MFQLGKPDFISQTRFWRLIIQHHRITYTDLALPHLNVAEWSNPSALKPEECMGDVWWYASWMMGINGLFHPKICQGLCIWYSGCKFWLPLEKYFLLVYSEVAEVTLRLSASWMMEEAGFGAFAVMILNTLILHSCHHSSLYLIKYLHTHFSSPFSKTLCSAVPVHSVNHYCPGDTVSLQTL